MAHAIRIHQYGGPEAMKWEEVAVGAPGQGQIKVKHHAVGVNDIDTYHRTGLYKQPSMPFTLGMEGAGEVTALGAGVTDLKVGDRIAYAQPIGSYATEVSRQAPPTPGQVVAAAGEALFTRDDILDGQTAWHSVGGMQLGSIWGHGAYQAPDWTADWLHRELTAWLDLAAWQGYGKPYAALDAAAQAGLREELKLEYRSNRVDPASGVLRVSARRAQAMAQTGAYYQSLFSDEIGRAHV